LLFFYLAAPPILIELSAQIRPLRRDFQTLVALGDPAAAARDIAGTAPKASIVGKVHLVAADEKPPRLGRQANLLC
jgi:hypothetical protein